MKDFALATLTALIILFWLTYEPSKPNVVIQKFEYKHCCHFETRHGQTIYADCSKYKIGDTIPD